MNMKDTLPNEDNKLLGKRRFNFDFDTTIIDKTNSEYLNKNTQFHKWNYNDGITKKTNVSSSNKQETKRRNQEKAKKDKENEQNDNLEELNFDNEDKFENELFEKDCCFADFKISKLLLKACSDLNFYHPTKVQAKVIPLVLDKNDVLVNAETGSGKTACYLLPIIQRTLQYKIKTLIVIPTRELALQCSQMLKSLLKYIDTISYVAILGGVSIDSQISQLQKEPDFIIATPGRLIDMLYNYKSINLSFINCLILDEADKLLELGFKDAIMEIINKMQDQTDKTKRHIQTLLFSATLNTNVIKLGDAVLKNPIKLKLSHSNILSNLKQSIVRMRFKSSNTIPNSETNPESDEDDNDDNDEDENEKSGEDAKGKKAKNEKNKHNIKISNKKQSKKSSLIFGNILNSDVEFNQRMSYLISLLKDKKKHRSIVFFNTKVECHKAFIILKRFNISAAEMHSDVVQSERILALENFQNNQIDYLLATDVIGRGIDVEKVKYVINFQMPIHAERYIHRIGRTARRGNLGNAITICNSVDRTIFKKLMKIQKFPIDPLSIDNDEIKEVYKKIKSYFDDMKFQLEQDQIDKELSLTEMTVDKAINKEANLSDISNRPRKMWYMNSKEKKKKQEELHKEYNNKRKKYFKRN